MASRVEGREKVAAVFGRLGDEIVDDLTKALDAGGAEIEAAAVLLAPKADGDLAASIGRDIRVREDGRAVRAVVFAGTDPATAIAAFRQEFGRAPSDDHPGHAAHEFMFPAYQALRKRVRGRVKRAIGAAVKRATKAGT